MQSVVKHPLSVRRSLSTRQRQAKMAKDCVELVRSLEIAEMPGTRNDRDPRTWNCIAHRLPDTQWRPFVGVAAKSTMLGR